MNFLPLAGSMLMMVMLNVLMLLVCLTTLWWVG
jgi:hypothetical protein